ncbi:hypothetical protein HDF18_13170 [Mucilaginibacter sp. X5P1]|uniref:hypothetical protein n=1 Tax=Mucilaginibacter sp. X5P1 TaxID=2723088 RepID=UPI00160B39B3|nr:hypothetical protein [Mucilaginibacter sp. X5P1]MBB6141708.1 hypothetical protein [Mucilaginibacter sp. X5P1]
MKTAIYFIISCLISTGSLLGGLHAKNPFPNFAVVIAVWALFAWGYNRRSKKEADKRSGERLFAEYMRSKIRNDRRQY